MSYEGSDNDEKLKTVPMINNSNNSNADTDSGSDTDIKIDNKTFLDEDINNKFKANPKTITNTKVVCAMKKLKTS